MNDPAGTVNSTMPPLVLPNGGVISGVKMTYRFMNDDPEFMRNVKTDATFTWMYVAALVIAGKREPVDLPSIYPDSPIPPLLANRQRKQHIEADWDNGFDKSIITIFGDVHVPIAYGVTVPVTLTVTERTNIQAALNAMWAEVDWQRSMSPFTTWNPEMREVIRHAAPKGDSGKPAPPPTGNKPPRASRASTVKTVPLGEKDEMLYATGHSGGGRRYANVEPGYQPPPDTTADGQPYPQEKVACGELKLSVGQVGSVPVGAVEVVKREMRDRKDKKGKYPFYQVKFSLLPEGYVNFWGTDATRAVTAINRLYSLSDAKGDEWFNPDEVELNKWVDFPDALYLFVSPSTDKDGRISRYEKDGVVGDVFPAFYMLGNHPMPPDSNK